MFFYEKLKNTLYVNDKTFFLSFNFVFPFAFHDSYDAVVRRMAFLTKVSLVSTWLSMTSLQSYHKTMQII